MKISIEEFNKIIPTICSRETSSNSNLWTEENPTYGHCAIVSVLAQECFGGEISKVSLKGTSFENLKSHLFNVIDTREIDFTKQQFGNGFNYQDTPREKQTREKILGYPGTQERYNILKKRYEISL
jgi:hypothetical protein